MSHSKRPAFPTSEDNHMKRKRNWAFLTLITATIAILAIGFYLGVTHQEARPSDNGAVGAGP